MEYKCEGREAGRKDGVWEGERKGGRKDGVWERELREVNEMRRKERHE